MQKGEDGYFRTQVDLEDGIYQYKFRVQSKSGFLQPDEWVEVNDPYMTEMDRRTERGIVHVKNGQLLRDTYVWQHDGNPLPANHELVIYELHVADFVGGETGVADKFQRAIDKLDYLADLGVNAIELMPITEYAGDYRWGYLVRYYFAPESSYGTPEDLKRFVDECHARGIRVIMDGIFNHTDDQSPLLLIDRDYWYYHDKHYPDDPANYWGPEFNYDHYDENLDIRPAWSFFGDVVRYWVEEYHIDGIRYDAVRQLANYEFFSWLTQQVDNLVAGKKPFFHIAEHIPDTSDIIKPQGPFEACWHESFRFFVKDAVLGEPIPLEKLQEALDPRQQGYPHMGNVINYLATHDREHMIVELANEGIVHKEAFRRVKMAATLLMTAPGVPLIWMGDEFAQNTHKTITTLQPNPLRWSLLEQPLNQDLQDFYKRLIALRKKVPAFLTDEIDFFHGDPEARVLAYLRWNEAGSRAIVVVNLNGESFPQYTCPNAPPDTTWHDWQDDRAITVEAGNLALNLPGFTAKILVCTS